MSPRVIADHIHFPTVVGTLNLLSFMLTRFVQTQRKLRVLRSTVHLEHLPISPGGIFSKVHINDNALGNPRTNIAMNSINQPHLHLWIIFSIPTLNHLHSSTTSLLIAHQPLAKHGARLNFVIKQIHNPFIQLSSIRHRKQAHSLQTASVLPVLSLACWAVSACFAEFFFGSFHLLTRVV